MGRDWETTHPLLVFTEFGGTDTGFVSALSLSRIILHAVLVKYPITGFKEINHP